MNTHRDKAVQLLDHYITLLMERPGARVLTVDNDTHAELAEVVDCIIRASVDITVKRLEGRAKELAEIAEAAAKKFDERN